MTRLTHAVDGRPRVAVVGSGVSGLTAAGVEVPDEVSVVGFDDHPDAAFYRPPLTTVRLDIAGEARRCVAVLLGDERSVDPAAPELVVRASTRCYR